jgi:hypothetical protein
MSETSSRFASWNRTCLTPPDIARVPLSWMELSTEPELFAYSTRIPDGLASSLFWMGVAILGIVLLYLTPHG